MGNRSDNFNRTSSSTTINSPSDGGSDWTVGAGTWGINSSNGGVKVSAGTDWSNCIYLEASTSSADVSVKKLANANWGPIARVADSSNYLLFQDSTGSSLDLWKRVAGTFTRLGSTYTGTISNGDVLKITVNSANDIRGYQNGVSRCGEPNDSAGSSNTKYGIAGYGGSQAFDDFDVTDTASTGVSVTTGVGALSITGYAPTVTAPISVTTGVGALSITGLAPTVTTQEAVTTGLGALTITGLAPNVSLVDVISVTTGVGALTLTGQAPTITSQETVTTGLGALTITGLAPGVQVTEQGTVVPGTGELTLTGLAPTVTEQIRITTGVGALSITGLEPSVQVVSDTIVTTGVGALTIAGYAPTAEILLNVLPGVGEIVITGYAPTIEGGEATEVPSTGQQPAGRPSRKPSKRRRKPVLVEIDGQQFVVSSEVEAEQLVETAVKAASEVAEKQAEEIIQKREKKAKKARLNTSPIQLDVPEITVRPADDGTIDPQWVADVNERMSRIREAFAEVAQRYETALLMKYQQELDEEDTLVALLLTI